MGVEPIGDRIACHPPVLKTGTITGPHALPRADIKMPRLNCALHTPDCKGFLDRAVKMRVGPWPILIHSSDAVELS